jgi:hypothetical protein
MKTNKQQLVILMLLVIPTSITIVTTTATQQTFAKNDASPDRQGLNKNGVPSQGQASGQTTSP